MKTTIQLLAGMCVLTLVACGSDSGPVGSAEAGLVESFPAESGACGPDSKVDEPGDQKDLCDGAPADEICVKAGPTCFCTTESGTYGDCYVFDLESGDVSRIGSGRDCKGISHTEYTCGEPPKCPPEQKPCMVSSECDKGEVCEAGCCVPEPPKCEPEQKPCMDSSECDKGQVCTDECCVPEPPKCDTPCGDKEECPKDLMCVDACCV